MEEVDLSVEELKRRLDNNEEILVLDVREPSEYEICNLGGVLIPLRQLPLRVSELAPAADIAVLCHHGERSRRAVQFLRQAGFPNARNVTGGIDAWAKRIDPTLATY